MTIKGVILNDIHFGIRDSQRIYKELGQFKDFIIKNKDELKTVIIAGDYFDRKLAVGDVATFYAISFFKELIDLCIKFNLKLRMIQGTRSHELNQLSLFFPFIGTDGLDFRIVEEASEEELFPDFNILYIPEEYPENSEEYYKEFKEKKYSAIFGHGTWDFVAFESQIAHGNRTDTFSAPVFIFNEWKDAIENGFVSFGHIHSRNVYKKKIYYSGSFSRWDFSDISERGFSYFEYDTEKKNFKLDFVNNTEAPTFGVFSLKENVENVEEMSLEDLNIILNEVIKKYDNTVLELSGISRDKQELLKEKYKENENVKIRIQNKSILLKESEDEKDKETFEKYSYIIKKELPLSETVKRYIKEEYKKEITLEKIKGVLEDGR